MMKTIASVLITWWTLVPFVHSWSPNMRMRTQMQMSLNPFARRSLPLSSSTATKTKAKTTGPVAATNISPSRLKSPLLPSLLPFRSKGGRKTASATTTQRSYRNKDDDDVDANVDANVDVFVNTSPSGSYRPDQEGTGTGTRPKRRRGVRRAAKKILNMRGFYKRRRGKKHNNGTTATDIDATNDDDDDNNDDVDNDITAHQTSSSISSSSDNTSMDEISLADLDMQNNILPSPRRRERTTTTSTTNDKTTTTTRGYTAVSPSLNIDETKNQNKGEESPVSSPLLFLPSTVSSSPRNFITNVHELRSAVFDHGFTLQDLEFNVSSFIVKDQKKTTAKPPFLSSPLIPNANANGNGNDKQKSPVTDNQQQQQHQQQQEKDSTNQQLQQVTDEASQIFDHEVIQLIQLRARTKSKPGSRAADDTAHLALSIEGGGMRGAVSAGMAAAIAVLGLSDSFDSIYGSSAGSVIGAYMISRQMCIDVYTKVLTTAKSKFVSKARLASSLATNLLDQAVNNTFSFALAANMNPAMNISFVLDSIMCPELGLRPLDLETFQLNDKCQPLRIVSSTVREGKMETHCLGSENMDFFDEVCTDTGDVLKRATTMVNAPQQNQKQPQKQRHGLFACLEASMTVPTATGAPLPIMRNKDVQSGTISRCFDAFCYEPIPYRSAVKEGATHVLVLKTRPDGNPIGTKPGLFEKVFAPMYFDSNNMPQVSSYFENGGQQYLYVEDYLTLEEGKTASGDGVLIPPPKILYGVEKDQEASSLISNRQNWKKAHLLPIAVPAGTPELSSLSVGRSEVIEAVRNGFATAFDLLAPCTGIELNAHLNGQRVANLIFDEHVESERNVLENPVIIAGDRIRASTTATPTSRTTPSASEEDESSDTCVTATIKLEPIENNANSENGMSKSSERKDHQCPKVDSAELLNVLPGLERGNMISLAEGLHRQIKQDFK